jgi:hypothetical protein
MTVGLSATGLANAWLNTMRNTSAASFTAPTDLYIQCHTADPGASGTTAVSTGIANRQLADWNAASAGSMALTATVSFSATGSDTITHLSVWSAPSAGTFYYSAALSASKSVTNGDTLNVTALTVALTPIAA